MCSVVLMVIGRIGCVCAVTCFVYVCSAVASGLDRPDEDKGGRVNVRLLGASGNGADDDTEALERAVAAVPLSGVEKGGTVYLPAGVYVVRRPINVPCNIRLWGEHGSVDIGRTSSYPGGAVLKWQGASDQPMLRVVSAFGVTVEGLAFDCGSGHGVTGVLLDSNNRSSGHADNFKRLTFVNCHVAFRWGSSGFEARQNDGASLTDVTIRGPSGDSTAEGIVINSGNAGQYSAIEQVVMQLVNIGIDLQVSGGVMLIDRIAFGTSVGKNARGIRFASPSDVTISGAESELGSDAASCGTSGSNFIQVTGGADMRHAIRLIGNWINDPVCIDRASTVVSIGNVADRQPIVQANAAGARVFSYGDSFAWQRGAGGGTILQIANDLTDGNVPQVFASVGEPFHFRANLHGPDVLSIGPDGVRIGTCSGAVRLREGSARVNDPCFTNQANSVVCTDNSGPYPVGCVPQTGFLIIRGNGGDTISYLRIR